MLEKYAPIAQLDRVSDYESEGCRFDSYWAHQKLRPMRSNLIGLFIIN